MGRSERPEGRCRLGFKKEGRKISKVIIDTDILIWYFRGNKSAKDFIAGIPYHKRLISIFCVMELIQGCANKNELKDVKEFTSVNFYEIIYPDEKITGKAISLLERHALSDGLRTIDALVAASAISNAAAIATANYKHFRNIEGLEVIRFHPKK